MPFFFWVALIAGIVLWIVIGSREGRYLDDAERAIAQWAFWICVISALLWLGTMGYDAEPHAKGVIASQYGVTSEDVEFREEIPIACTRYNCHSWKGIVYVYGQRVGIVEYSDDNHVQFTEDTPGYIPEKPLPPPPPILPEGQIGFLITRDQGATDEAVQAALDNYETETGAVLSPEQKESISTFLVNNYTYVVSDMTVVFTSVAPANYSYFVLSNVYFNAYEVYDELWVEILPEY